jgi:hypothetical protein
VVSTIEPQEKTAIAYLPKLDRQVPRKPHLACPVKYEVHLTGVGGDESSQFKNSKLHCRDAPRCAREASLFQLLIISVNNIYKII